MLKGQELGHAGLLPDATHATNEQIAILFSDVQAEIVVL